MAPRSGAIFFWQQFANKAQSPWFWGLKDGGKYASPRLAVLALTPLSNGSDANRHQISQKLMMHIYYYFLPHIFSGFYWSTGLPQDFENEIPGLSRTFWENFPGLFQDLLYFLWRSLKSSMRNLTTLWHLTEFYCAAKRHEYFCWKVTVKAGKPLILRTSIRDWLNFKLLFPGLSRILDKKIQDFSRTFAKFTKFRDFSRTFQDAKFFPGFPGLSRTRGNPEIQLWGRTQRKLGWERICGTPCSTRKKRKSKI